jgi:hypothetical protein
MYHTCGLSNTFELLKKCLVSEPILSFPDFQEEFQLQTDASGTHVGAVLCQASDEGSAKVIAYISHKLTDQEQKWDVRDREAFAVVWACDQLRYYLIGKHFSVETDSENIAHLRWILNYKKPGRWARWALLLQEFEFTITPKPGKENQNADALTRLERVSNVNEYELGKDDHHIENEDDSELDEENDLFEGELPSLAEFRKMQSNDPLLNRVIARLKGNPSPEEELSEYLAFGGKFSISPATGLLTFSETIKISGRKPFVRERQVVPPKLRFVIC